jgi:hypothetical protein
VTGWFTSGDAPPAIDPDAVWNVSVACPAGGGTSPGRDSVIVAGVSSQNRGPAAVANAITVTPLWCTVSSGRQPPDSGYARAHRLTSSSSAQPGRACERFSAVSTKDRGDAGSGGGTRAARCCRSRGQLAKP